jgi:transposase
MEELIKILDENLQYTGCAIKGSELQIRVNSAREKARCPQCEQISHQVHSRKIRTLKDLPIQGKKVKILLEQKKYFCKNKSCKSKTFAERFDFYEPKATKTKRLQEEILKVALTQSSVAASRYLRSSIADIRLRKKCYIKMST